MLRVCINFGVQSDGIFFEASDASRQIYFALLIIVGLQSQEHCWCHFVSGFVLRLKRGLDDIDGVPNAVLFGTWVLQGYKTNTEMIVKGNKLTFLDQPAGTKALIVSVEEIDWSEVVFVIVEVSISFK